MTITIKDHFSLEAKEGESLLTALSRSGIILPSPCGGRGYCKKCLVQILQGNVNGTEPDKDGWVLACRAKIQGNLLINRPENNIPGENEISHIIPGKKVHDKKILKAGIALDIGTTTIAASLLNLDDEREGFPVLDVISELNAQLPHGGDIMSRIDAARKRKTAELHLAINDQTREIIKHFMDKWSPGEIEKLIVSGNTVMLHFFLNVDPSGMGEVPFTPVFLEERIVKGSDLGLPAGEIIILPSISSFVGADIVSGMAALNLQSSPDERPSIFIDIGTNGEIALLNRGKIFCTSTAAGPAFEGAEIHMGMGGVLGAINRVEHNGEEFVVSTIGSIKPRGICGSGLIDTVALMLDLGIIDETGYMEAEGGEFFLTPGIKIINRDIRQFQLAKSAILSGIKILCKRTGLGLDEIANVYIAGGFGFFINKTNAVKSGLFPKEFLDKITVCGNLSLKGAEDALRDRNFLDKCRELKNACVNIDLSVDPDFMIEFSENMLF